MASWTTQCWPNVISALETGRPIRFCFEDQEEGVVTLRRRLSAKDHEGRPNLRAVALQRGEARCFGMPQQCQPSSERASVVWLAVPPTTKSARPSPSKSAVAKLVMETSKTTQQS